MYFIVGLYSEKWLGNDGVFFLSMTSLCAFSQIFDFMAEISLDCFLLISPAEAT